MGNHHWKKIAAVMLAAAIGIQPVYVQAKTREEIQQEREQKKSEQQGTQSQYKQSQSKVSSLEGQQDALEEEIQELDIYNFKNCVFMMKMKCLLVLLL